MTTTTRRALLRASLGATLTCALTCARSARGAPAKRAARRPPRVDDSVVDHDTKIALRVKARTARPGKILVFDVVAPATSPPLVAMGASLGGRAAVTFPVARDGRRFRGLVAVEIEEAAKSLPLVVDATPEGLPPVTFHHAVALLPGGYDRRSITVGRKFTSPSLAEQERAEEEAKALSAAYQQTSTGRLWRGSFVKPTAGPETAPFGTLRTYNNKRKSRHLGLDLDGAIGDRIVAAQRGRVLLAADRFYSGGTVLLDHGQGLMTMYFHMSRIDVAVGQLVERGVTLGAIGASGQVTGPHLHLSVRFGGTNVDPAQLLALDLADDVEPLASAIVPVTDDREP